jgi:hypothetical protein
MLTGEINQLTKYCPPYIAKFICFAPIEVFLSHYLIRDIHTLQTMTSSPKCHEKQQNEI